MYALNIEKMNQPATFRIIQALAIKSLNVSDITKRSNLTFSWVFKLIQKLDRMSIVKTKKSGRQIIVSLTKHGRKKLGAILELKDLF